MNDYIDEFLRVTNNRLNNGIQNLYDMHNTKINMSIIECDILPMLKLNISKKINNSSVISNLSFVSNKLLNMARVRFDSATKEGLEENNASLFELQKSLGSYFVSMNQSLVNISFEEEMKEALNEIFKRDRVYNESLRYDLKNLFNSELNNLQYEVQLELKMTIKKVEDMCNDIIMQTLLRLKNELTRYETETQEKQENEKNGVLFNDNLVQIEQDKNFENKVEEKGRTL